MGFGVSVSQFRPNCKSLTPFFLSLSLTLFFLSLFLLSHTHIELMTDHDNEVFFNEFYVFFFFPAETGPSLYGRTGHKFFASKITSSFGNT
jgi:hypothetical protein